ncbi:interleukin-13 receptor subunit alpha-2 isoform X2 [Xiphias gladius]|uniref:interleukin-13 receptor subunit alpha-2 isoform X2 n=1 Tax=Xiphias gladius TaxID=8245 RepID=UPI001A98E1A6|nr:interleukin-13 receptor subunit alpha-2 isoform X2 [Xiphias gladius]
MGQSTHTVSVSSTLPEPATEGKRSHLLSVSARNVMASNFSVTHQATLMLLLVTCTHLNELAVDPPEDLLIVDLGHLGHLEITWSPPAILIEMKECPEFYQLEYFNTYRESWTAIRTPKRSYSTQFDLMKDIRVRVYTLLSGPCTNGTMIKSTTYTELVQKPPNTGVGGIKVEHFICVFSNMERMECNWRRNPQMPANSQQYLYFWHKDLEQAEECPQYIISGGVRSGCNFTGKALPDYSDINFCINGSSLEGPLKPTFISLQIQNHVKPGTTEKLHLQTGPDTMEIQWESPLGRIPGHCLEWEVEHRQEAPDGKIATLILTKRTSLTLPLIHNHGRDCFRVRSKLHKYCADKSFWSEWSRPTCRPEMKVVASKPEWDMAPAYVYIAVAIIATLVMSLCLGAVLKVRRSRQEKKPDSLLTSPFARRSLTENHKDAIQSSPEIVTTVNMLLKILK